MTIRKGEAWGSVGPLPTGAVRVHSDAELHRQVNDALARRVPLPPLALLGGSMMRAVGGTGDATRLDREVAVLPIDLLRLELDGTRTVHAVAHVVARRSWWRGRIVAAMNAQFLDERDLAPRAHPNDGRVDVLEVAASMSVRDRWRALARSKAGTHLPHPALAVRQTSSVELAFDRPTRVWADGVAIGSCRVLRIEVEPDACTVCV